MIINPKYVSPFNADNAELQATLDRCPKLGKAAIDFASAFNLQIAQYVHDQNKGVTMLTQEGVEAGALLLRNEYSRKHDEYVDYFLYRSPLIQKERSTGRSTRYEHDSEKITGIITAVKKNNEVPTTKALMKKLTTGMRYAFSAVTNTADESVEAKIKGPAALGLMRLFIEGDKVSVEAHRKEVEDVYASYLDQCAKVSSAKKDAVRFTGGCTAILIKDSMIDAKPRYYVTEATYNASTVGVTLSDTLTVYKSLKDSPLAPEVTIIRAAMEGNVCATNDNDLGLGFYDKYHPEVDIATGYQSRSDGLWVLIPKVGG